MPVRTSVFETDLYANSSTSAILYEIKSFLERKGYIKGKPWFPFKNVRTLVLLSIASRQGEGVKSNTTLFPPKPNSQQRMCGMPHMYA